MKMLLATLHARYIHASLALPAIAAACADLQNLMIVIREYTINEPTDAILRRIVAEEADLVAFSCYIWNIEQVLRLAADLRLVQPDVCIVVGGPEVSSGAYELLAAHPALDAVVRGEGEGPMRALAQALAGAAGRDAFPRLMAGVDGIVYRDGEEIVATPAAPATVELDRFPSPFAAGLVDLRKPLVYYESSRGCPFSCAYCMSSLEPGVRVWSPGRVRSDLAILLERQVKVVKFVDRTFNFDAVRANELWRYLLEHNRTSTFHFEIAADLLTDANLALLREVPDGLFRFEIGVQSTAADTLERVTRTSDLGRLAENVRRLLAETRITVHLDLVAGLPGEDYEGFLGSLALLLSLGPHHIQVEPLKLLKGTAMRRIAEREGYVWSGTPPYKILRTPDLSYREIVRIETIARLLDLYYNSGRFGTALAQIGALVPPVTFWDRCAAFPAWEETASHLSLRDQFELFWQAAEAIVPAEGHEAVRDALRFDYCRTGYPAGKLPSFFPPGAADAPAAAAGGAHRQARLMVGDREGKVRGFSGRFARDYRVAGWPAGPVELVFAYLSAPDRGERVFVERADAPPDRVAAAAV